MMIVNATLNFLKIIFLLFLLSFATVFAAPLEIAITVDDLPQHGPLPAGQSRLAIAQQMLAALKKHNIKGVYGFVNGSRVSADNLSVLEAWMAEGQLLANHTYSHLDLDTTSANAYMQDIIKNTAILEKLMGDKNYRYFRYAYLAEGNTAEKRDQVRKFLFSNGYKVAAVTTDFFEYEWNEPYQRCLLKNDQAAIAWLKQSFIEESLNALTVSHALSEMLFGRDIKNILLLHIGVFDALMLDDLLTAYEKAGVKFISLPEALEDDVYNINPGIARNRTYTFLNQIRLARALPNPKIVADIYQHFPEKKLRDLC